MAAVQIQKSAELSFGIRIDGRDLGISFRSLADARVDGRLLSARGYRNVLIFDRVSCEIVDACDVQRLRA